MSLKQSYAFPRISTRGHFNLNTGEKISDKSYFIYPKKKFKKIESGNEVVIFVHGMRNSRKGAIIGAKLLRKKLLKLGKNIPVVSFSYDSDVKGAHLEEKHAHSIAVASLIAGENSYYLRDYIISLVKKNPKIKIHIVGHSLGCELVYWTLFSLSILFDIKDSISTVHMFGSPVESEDLANAGKVFKITNYYNPLDDLIIEEVDRGLCRLPSCLVQVNKNNVKTKKLLAEDHRFRSYVNKLRSFP